MASFAFHSVVTRFMQQIFCTFVTLCNEWVWLQTKSNGQLRFRYVKACETMEVAYTYLQLY